MAPYMGYVKRNSVIRVYRRTLDDDDRPEDMDAELGGGFWEYIDNAEGPEIDVFPAPASDEYVVVQCSRSYEPLWLDTDVTSGPEALARLAVGRRRPDRLFRLRQLHQAHHGGRPALAGRRLV